MTATPGPDPDNTVPDGISPAGSPLRLDTQQRPGRAAPRQHGRAEAHLVHAAHVQFVPEQWRPGQVGVQPRPQGAAALAVTAASQ